MTSGYVRHAAHGGWGVPAPERARDVAAVEAWIQKLRAEDVDLDAKIFGWRKFAADLLRNLHLRPRTRLSEKQRAIVAEGLGLQVLPPVPMPPIPEVLKHLPKRPPGKP